MSRPVIGRYAPPPRPTARRLSDLHPYARLSLPEPDRLDRWIGRVSVVLLALALLALTLGWID